jgi:KDO2-lipid IV(A) lauroyltransferase
MNLRRRIRMIGETVLVGIALVTVPIVPRRGVVALAGLLGRAAFALSPTLRRISLANLAAALPELPEDERRAMARAALVNASLVVVDVLWFAAWTRRRVDRYVRFDPSFEDYFRTAPLVAITGHLGNWEVLGLAVAQRGAPLLSVANPVKSPVVDRFMLRSRRATGQKVVSRAGAVRGLLRGLRQGGRIGLLMDQNTLPSHGGVFVSFFGLQASMSDVVATLCTRTGAPFMVSCCIPDAKGTYTAYGLPVRQVAGTEAVPQNRITQQVADDLEVLIRRHPRHWVWAYKRWKYVPNGLEAHRYPFYAVTKMVESVAETTGEEPAA